MEIEKSAAGFGGVTGRLGVRDPGPAFPPWGEEIEKMQKFGNGFVPLYADYAQMIDCTEEASTTTADGSVSRCWPGNLLIALRIFATSCARCTRCSELSTRLPE